VGEGEGGLNMERIANKYSIQLLFLLMLVIAFGGIAMGLTLNNEWSRGTVVFLSILGGSTFLIFIPVMFWMGRDKVG